MTDGIHARLEAAATVIRTPAGSGDLVWRRWGEGPPVVLLHGGHGSWTHWLRNIEPLAAEASVVVPDLPAHGDSGLPADPVDGASHVAALLGGLRAVIGEERAALVGFSLGASIGIRLAAQPDAAIRSILLLGAGGFGERARLPLAGVRRLVDEAEIERAHRHNLATLMLADPGLIDAETVRLQRENVARSRIQAGAIAWPTTTRVALRALSIPVRGAYGERDATVVPSAARRREELLEVRPDAEVTIVPGAGHWVQFEAPAAVNALIRATLLAG